MWKHMVQELPLPMGEDLPAGRQVEERGYRISVTAVGLYYP